MMAQKKCPKNHEKQTNKQMNEYNTNENKQTNR